MTNAGQQNRGKKQGGTANLTNAGKGRRKGVPNRTTAALKVAGDPDNPLKTITRIELVGVDPQ